MREIGIPMNPWSVHCLLLGRKTMTARLMNPQPMTTIDRLEDWLYVERYGGQTIQCRYRPGNLLYVKEAVVNCGIAAYYAADYAPLIIPTEHVDFLTKGRANVPATFMSRWAARIWLECLDVKPRIVQQFTDEDFIAEGCIDGEQEYRDVWNGINMKRGYAWDAGGWWVWTIKFRRTEHGLL